MFCGFLLVHGQLAVSVRGWLPDLRSACTAPLPSDRLAAFTPGPSCTLVLASWRAAHAMGDSSLSCQTGQHWSQLVRAESAHLTISVWSAVPATPFKVCSQGACPWAAALTCSRAAQRMWSTLPALALDFALQLADTHSSGPPRSSSWIKLPSEITALLDEATAAAGALLA